MNQFPFISVVIPAYNEERRIGNCLTSLKNQKFSNFEIIVVDNNSTDKTLDIAKKFGIEVVKEPKQGYIFALNTGMKKARGEIIAVTDADTTVSSHWLELIDKCFKNKLIVAMTGSIYIKTDSWLYNSFVHHIYDFFLWINFCLGKPHISGFNFAVRNDFFKKIGGLDKRFSMSCDVDLGLRIKQYGKVVFEKNAYVVADMRRWNKNFGHTFKQYFSAYFSTVWLRKPPKITQIAVR